MTTPPHMTEEDDEEHFSLIPSPTKNSKQNHLEYLLSARWHINKHMLSSKVAYFFEYMKEGSHWPYLVLFYVSIGLSPTQAGFIAGIRFIGGAVGAPVIGWIADKSGLHRHIAIIVCFFAAATNFSQPVVIMLIRGPSKNFGHLKNHHAFKTHAANTSILSMTNAVPIRDSTEAQKLFYVLLGVSTAASFFDGTTLGFVDSGVLRKIASCITPTDIGQQRIFGPNGLGVAAFLSGVLVEHFPKGRLSCYTGIFIVYAIACLGMAVTFYFLLDDKMEEGAQTESVNELLLSNLKNTRTWTFFFIVLFNGIAQSLAFSFSFLFLDELHVSNTIKGLSLLVNGLSGLCGFLLSKTIIKGLGGNMNAMTFSCMTWSLRFGFLSMITQGYQFLLICLLNGLTCSLFVSAYVGYIRKHFPPTIFTAVCGMAGGIYMSGAYVIGNIFGGAAYQHLGPRLLFTLCSSTFLAGAAVNFLYSVLQWLYDNRK